MASANHDFIVAMIARKMRTLGFEIICIDGRYKDISNIRCDIPPKILTHRPDVVGRKAKQAFCVGEAKTMRDLSSRRTGNQFKDFISVVSVNPRNRLFIGIPSSAKDVLHNLLAKLGVLAHKQLTIIYVPDILLPSDEKI